MKLLKKIIFLQAIALGNSLFASAPAATYTPEETELIKIYNEDITKTNERRVRSGMTPFTTISVEGARCEPSLLSAAQEHAKRIKWAKYEQEKQATISQAIKAHDYDVMRKEIPALAKALNERYGEDGAQSFLTNALNEAIHSDDLTSVKMVISAESTRKIRKLLNPVSTAGPQGRFTPLWHAEDNARKPGTAKGEEIYQYLLKLAREQ